MVNTLSIFLLGVFGEVVWRKLHQFRQAVHLAIITIQLLELNCFGVIGINKIEHSLNLVICKGIV